MLRVALTGGIGSGKTTAANMFRELGCFVSQSDEVARAMMQPGQAVFQSIVSAVGKGVRNADGTIDRGALSRAAFDDGRIEELNAIVHPPVIQKQAEWMREMAQSHPSGVVMVESALVFETRHGECHSGGRNAPWRTRFDRIVLVTAPEALRIERYLLRSGVSGSTGRGAAEADVRRRMQAQLPDETKVSLADFVVRNEGTREDLRRQVEAIWGQLCHDAADAAAKPT